LRDVPSVEISSQLKHLEALQQLPLVRRAATGVRGTSVAGSRISVHRLVSPLLDLGKKKKNEQQEASGLKPMLHGTKLCMAAN
jgi:hypothetical protein